MAAALPRALEERKSAANTLFSAGRFAAARDAYTDAIIMLPPVGAPFDSAASTLFSNRAMAHKALGEWPRAAADAREALARDRLNAKAHYVLGLALQADGALADATARVERAADMARRQKRPASLIAQFEDAAATVRAAWFAATQEAEEEGEWELQAKVLESVGADARVRVPRPRGGTPYSATKLPAIDDSGARAAEAAAAVAAARAPPPADARVVDRLDALFAARRDARANRVVPEWALDPVSLDVMLDPVVGPSGQSYDRRVILACLAAKPECPVSRAPLNAKDLVPNVGLRNAIRAFLAEAPWAHPAATNASKL